MTAPARYLRRPARRTRRRTHPGAFLAGVAVLAWAAWELYRLLAAHAAASITGAVLLLAAAGVLAVVRHRLHRRAQLLAAHRSRSLADYLAMDDVQFEYALADLCRRDGCTRVVRVGGANDYAADVLATLPDRRWWQIWLPRSRRILIQAKRYRIGNHVPSEVIQAVNGMYRDIHRTQVAAVVTTSEFTADAIKLNRKLPTPLRLVNGDALGAWAAGGPPPWAH